MEYFDALAESLAERLETGLIGEPVALRLHLQLSADHGLLLPAAAVGLRLSQDWFEAETEIRHVQGSIEAGYLSLLAQARGRTALINAEVMAVEQTDAYVRLLLVGNQGTAEFSDAPAELEAPLPPSARPLLERIQRALEQGGAG